jgi:hypothetical protein
MHAETPMYRRCRLSALTIAERGKSTRRGVRLRTAPKVHIAISPETCRSLSIGLAPSWPVRAGTMRRQTPTPDRMASVTSLFPRNSAANPRDLAKDEDEEGFRKEFRSCRSSEYRIQEAYFESPLRNFSEGPTRRKDRQPLFRNR